MFQRGRELNIADALRAIASEVRDPHAKERIEQIADDLATEPVQELVTASEPIEGGRLIRSLRRALEGRKEESRTEPAPANGDEARRAYFEQVRSGYLSTWAEHEPLQPVYLFAVDYNDDAPEMTHHIYVTFRWWGEPQVICEVRDPDGNTSMALVKGSIFMQGNNFQTTYPDAFPGTLPLRAGEYLFVWKRPPRLGEPPGYQKHDLVRDTVVVTRGHVEATERPFPPLEVRREKSPYVKS